MAKNKWCKWEKPEGNLSWWRGRLSRQVRVKYGLRCRRAEYVSATTLRRMGTSQELCTRAYQVMERQEWSTWWERA